MHSLERRLSEQNELRSWVDCNLRGLGHQWEQDPLPDWYHCRRASCAVSTTWAGQRPPAHLIDEHGARLWAPKRGAR